MIKSQDRKKYFLESFKQLLESYGAEFGVSVNDQVLGNRMPSIYFCLNEVVDKSGNVIEERCNFSLSGKDMDDLCS